MYLTNPNHFEVQTRAELFNAFKGTRGVQHGVWTRLQSFLIIRESIDYGCDGSAKIVKAANGGQHEM